MSVRIPIAALLGALAGIICVVVGFAVTAGFELEMDRPLPRRLASGFYSPERAGDLTFVWTSGSAMLRLGDFDRRLPWRCTLRFRGGGPDLHRTTVDVAADGVTLVRAAAPGDFQDVEVTIPPGPRAQLTLGITASPIFVPGPADRRELGLQVDRIACAPEGVGMVLPPAAAIRAAAVGAAAFGAALGLAGISILGIGCAVLLLAAGQTILLAAGVAAYSDFPSRMLSFGLWMPLLAATATRAIETWSGHRPSKTAIFVIFFSAAAVYLKALGLIHPSKLLIDAVFHAHRLEWVLAGRYFFTQPMPSGVSFPYAIGLYVFAAPWTMLTNDYVSLLRVLVSASEVLAGLLLYPLIVRAWGDRLAGALAVVLYNMVPLAYGLIGNANLTNAFGQSVALATLAAASIWALQLRRIVCLLAVFLLASLAFLSHISTFAQLFTTSVAAAALYGWRGGRDLRPAAIAILLVTILAAALAVITYYGRFIDVYKAAMRVRAETAAVDVPLPSVAGEAQAGSGRAEVRLPARIGNAVDLTIAMIGWSILLLAVVGVWSLWVDGARDRLVLLLAAWGMAYAVFFGLGVLPRVDAPFQRYAAEFVGRVNFAAYPAAVVLAARGTAWAWRRGTPARLAAVVLLVVSVATGVRHWAAWVE